MGKEIIFGIDSAHKKDAACVVVGEKTKDGTIELSKILFDETPRGVNHFYELFCRQQVSGKQIFSWPRQCGKTSMLKKLKEATRG